MRAKLLALLMISSVFSYAQPATTYLSNATGGGNIVNNSTWQGTPSLTCNIAGNDTYEVLSGDSVFSLCTTLDFSGNTAIIVRSGGVLYVSGNGGITGNVDLTVEGGGRLIVTGDMNLGGSSTVDNDGYFEVGGDITGPGKSFDCDGSSGTGTVEIGGTGCSACDFGSGGACNEAPLPIELVDFNAEHSESGVFFSWATLNEVNNDYFTLEHSDNGVDFEAIAHVDGAGNSSEIIDYTHHHPEVQYGKSFYRLKQTDYDGSISHSEIIAIEYGPTDMFVFPNPSTGVFDIIAEGLDGDVNIQLIDNHGVIVHDETAHFSHHMNHYKIDVHHKVPTGMYVLRVITNSKIMVEHIVIH